MAIPPSASSDAPSDAELLAAARGGDDAAFAALVRRHQRQVERIVIRMLGRDGRDDADDVAQETFIRFHGALGDFRAEAAVSTYLTRIAINLSLNVLRRRRWQLRRLVRRDTADPAAPDMRDVPAPATVDRTITDERRAALERALGRLSDDHRAVVVCRLLEDLSTRETAALLRIPDGTVMSRLTRALEKLREDAGILHLETP